MTTDIDSTICQVYGKQKHGSAYGYTKVLGKHPLVATRAGTGEVLHIRHRKGSAASGRGAPRFVRETIGRTRRAGATGPLTLRADSGFHSKHVVAHPHVGSGPWRASHIDHRPISRADPTVSLSVGRAPTARRRFPRAACPGPPR